MTERTAVVVGGAGAIGEACGEALMAGGFRVAVADVDRAGAERVASRLGADAAVTIDVTSSDSVRSGLNGLADRWGRMDVAVNLAAVAGPRVALHAYDDDEWSRIVDVNLTGTFRCLREQLRLMSRFGAGSVVVVSSVGAEIGFPEAAAYSTTKHALTGLVRSAAVEYAAHGVRVNAVLPGFVDTPFLRGRRTPAELERLAMAHPLGRLAKPGEVAAVVAFLASSASDFVTGSCYEVDGGFLAGRPLGAPASTASGRP